ncbi:unnamed protein product [Protopolystoma xenopodis]|uniref:Uncharacterized protein n=1 Tax=Protopolystoma xenopodis TaxID=117903 RepID=A0A448WWX3_9PLAT|nr:unnamed protein product [Protopolystoma xenopodis]
MTYNRLLFPILYTQIKQIHWLTMLSALGVDNSPFSISTLDVGSRDCGHNAGLLSTERTLLHSSLSNRRNLGPNRHINQNELFI